MAVELLGGLKVKGKIVALDGIEDLNGKAYVKVTDDVSVLVNANVDKTKKLASEKYVDDLVSGAVRYKGSCTNAELQAKTSTASHGDMWNITDNGTFARGTNVVMIVEGGTKTWDPMANPVIGDGALAITIEDNPGTGTFTANQASDTTGTIALTLPATGVTEGTYGSALNVPKITIDAKGRITSAVDTAISMPTVNNGTLTVTFDGTAGTGSFTANQAGNSTIALVHPTSGVTATTYGSATKIPIIAVNDKGHITGASEAEITIPTVNKNKLTLTYDSETPIVFEAGGADDKSFTVPAPSNATITLSVNGTANSFTLNQSEGKTIELSIPSVPSGFNISDGTALAVGEGTVDKTITIDFEPCVVQFFDANGQNVILPYKKSLTGFTILALGSAVTQAYTYSAMGWVKQTV